MLDDDIRLHTDLIAAVYDAVIEPRRWHDALDAVRGRFNFHNVAMSVILPLEGKLLVNLVVNIPDDYARMASQPEYVEEIV